MSITTLTQEQIKNYLPDYTFFEKMLYSLPTIGLVFKNTPSEIAALEKRFFTDTTLNTSRNLQLYLELKQRLITPAITFNLIAVCIAVCYLFFMPLGLVVTIALPNLVDLLLNLSQVGAIRKELKEIPSQKVI